MEAQLLYRGKTKDLYALGEGQVLFQFKDDVTGKDGVFDPGANEVGLSIEGIGRENLAMSAYFFKVLEERGIPTHFLSADVEKGQMRARMARPFGKGVEVICRRRAVGSFVRRYGAYAESSMPLDNYVEMTLKDDQRGDPLITMEGLAALHIMDEAQYQELVALTRRITDIITETLKGFGLELIDIKYEYGMAGDELLLIDEISAGNMRVWQDGQTIEALDLTRQVLRQVRNA